MGQDLSRTADETIVSATWAADAPTFISGYSLDLPHGDNLAAIRAAWDALRDWRLWIAHHADAAERVGYPKMARLWRVQIQAADEVMAELQRMWLGDDTATPNVVDELRLEIDRLNHRLERLLERRTPPASDDPPDP